MESSDIKYRRKVTIVEADQANDPYEVIDSEEETKLHAEKVKRKDQTIDGITDALVLAFFIALPLKILYQIVMWYYPGLEGSDG